MYKNCRKIITVGMSAVLFMMSACVEGQSSASAKEPVRDYVLISQGEQGMSVRTAELSTGEAEEYKQEKPDAIVEPDILVKGSGEESASSSGSAGWNMEMIHAGELPDDKDGSVEKVKVAVIDSGIDFTEDINVVARKNFVPGEDNVSVLYEDDCGHGTSVAGIIGAKDNEIGVTGVNENVENNSAPVSRVIEGINWAVEQDVDIINLSLGTEKYSEALACAVRQAASKGILMVAAAGNGEQIEYPAAFKDVMAVGSVSADGTVSDGSACGEALDVVAPGEQISSTGAFDGIMTAGGTSMAAPHVTGIASVLLEKNKDVPTKFIRQLICASARPVGDAQEYGNGVVDLAYALENYDEAWEAYQAGGHDELSVDEVIETNDGELECFDDVNVVEGRWFADKHESMADQASGISGTSLTMLKKGARLPDNESYGIQGMTNYPQFHGYYGEDKTTNYIACYNMLTKMAVKYSKGNYTDPANITGLSTKDYNALTSVVGGGIGNKTWKEILGSDDTDKNKSMVVYGMALHTMSDVYAHCAYVDGKKIRHKIEGTGEKMDENGNGVNDADDPHRYPNRYECAGYAVKNLLSRAKNIEEGSAVDFVFSASLYNGKFKLGKLSDCAKGANPTIYNNNKSFFDSMNINI